MHAARSHPGTPPASLACRAQRRRASEPIAVLALPGPIMAAHPPPQKRTRTKRSAGPTRSRGQGGQQRESPTLREREREGRLLWVDDETSARMRLVRQKGTRPELMVRRLLAELGHRYRLSNRDLPGSPDIANRQKAWAIFVHGCFWHRHGCKATTTPTRNREFWQAKFERNVARDRRSIEALEAAGYKVVVIWECQTKQEDGLVRAELVRCLGRDSTRAPNVGEPL
jgi:DNA mismatch endonuclease, patch repair protein